MVADLGPLYEACRAMKLVTINYTDKKGVVSVRTGGIYEIRSTEGKLWFWDTTENVHIYAYFLNSINSFEVRNTDFVPSEWPVIIDGETIG